MTDEEYIRKAVELADGWRVSYYPSGDVCTITNQDKLWQTGWCQSQLDALAAQLVRQVDALAPKVVISVGFHGEVMIYDWDTDNDWWAGGSKGKGDRTMNTIKAIVDSGVLEGQSDE